MRFVKNVLGCAALLRKPNGTEELPMMDDDEKFRDLQKICDLLVNSEQYSSKEIAELVLSEQVPDEVLKEK